MAKNKTRRNVEPEGAPSAVSLPFCADDAIVDARVAVDNALLEYLNARLKVLPPDEAAILPADFSDGLLVSVLKLIAPSGQYPMEEGRFWQILDRYGPFLPLRPEAALQARLVKEVEGLFAAAKNDRFEDGFDSALSLELRRLVLKYGGTTIQIISDLLHDDQVAPEVAAEAVRCLAEMRNEETREARRRLLERSLASPSPVVRDGAVVGLSQMFDPLTIPALETAVARESYRLLRASMLDLLEQLRALSP